MFGQLKPNKTFAIGFFLWIIAMASPLFIQYSRTVVSHHKLNKSSWLEESSENFSSPKQVSS